MPVILSRPGVEAPVAPVMFELVVKSFESFCFRTVFEAAIDVAGEARQSRGNRGGYRAGAGTDGLRHPIVQRQQPIVGLHLRDELLLGQCRVVGDDVDIDGGIAGAPNRIEQRGECVMPVEEIELTTRPDHHRLDLVHEIGFD
jgi:hypothetical protein